MIFYQILSTNIVNGDVWRSVCRICMWILGLKRLKDGGFFTSCLYGQSGVWYGISFEKRYNILNLLNYIIIITKTQSIHIRL